MMLNRMRGSKGIADQWSLQRAHNIIRGRGRKQASLLVTVDRHGDEGDGDAGSCRRDLTTSAALADENLCLIGPTVVLADVVGLPLTDSYIPLDGVCIQQYRDCR
jgi:hypothetical protein